MEVFKDVEKALCPAESLEIEKKVARLASSRLLAGTRGNPPADRAGFIDAVVRVSHLMADFPNLLELDINPLRVFDQGDGVMALDARAVVGEMPPVTEGNAL